MSSTSPASTSARTVLYRHMCCEPDMKVMTSPLCARRRCISATSKTRERRWNALGEDDRRTVFAGAEEDGFRKVGRRHCRRQRVIRRSSRGWREQLTGWRLPSDLLGHGVHCRGILVRFDESDVAVQAQRTR